MFHRYLNVPWKAEWEQRLEQNVETFFLHSKNGIVFVIASWHVLWFENQEYSGMYFEIFNWFKFVSFAFDSKAECKEIADETFKKKKNATTTHHRIGNSAKMIQELRSEETSGFPLYKLWDQQPGISAY